MLLRAGPIARLGSPNAPVRFGEEPKADGAWAGRRLMMLGDAPAFELSFWCGTCQFLFRRLEGANETVSIEEVQGRLAEGVTDLDPEIINTFAPLIGEDEYLPLLLSITPRLTLPSGADDYFAQEQVATWGLSSFWGLPEYPSTPYYRTFETRVDVGAHLFEFVVPMVPPTWNDSAKVADHASRLATSSAPTAVAVSTLDVCQPAMDDQSDDYYEHWGLTHFLLDGHHKVAAAAATGRPLQLLALVAVESSLASREQVQRLPGLLAAPQASRPSAGP